MVRNTLIQFYLDGLIYFGSKSEGTTTYDSFIGTISDARFY